MTGPKPDEDSGNHQPKSSAPRPKVALSPAVSAFQFMPNHLSPHRSGEWVRSLSSDGRSNSSSAAAVDLRRSASNHAGNNRAARSPSPVAPKPPAIKDGYVYKDEIIILDKERKEELLKVGEIELQSEWTFWYDR